MLKTSFSQKRKKQKGMAIIEMIPIVIVIILLVNFSIGFFGIIHTGILNSIAARNYAFETFRHRSNLTYFAINNATNADKRNAYDIDQQRTHVTLSEKAIDMDGDDTVVTSRMLDFLEKSEVAGSKEDHNNKILSIEAGRRSQDLFVNPVWIRTAYGICINATCGGD